MLTNQQLRGLKPGPKARKVSDSGGLYIEVTPTGSKLWRLAYRIDGKQKLLALGSYPAVPLAEARSERDAVKGQLAEGVDPSEERRRERERAEAAAIPRDDT